MAAWGGRNAAMALPALPLRTPALALCALLHSARGLDLSPWYGRSIYFLVVDRFALTEHDSARQCAVVNATVGYGPPVSQWCGGTIKGVTRKLDYIQGMGFDAIWITPVVKAVPWGSWFGSAGYDGYWAMDWNKIDPHFGTEQDLKILSHELHRRNMLFMMDSVVNHAGPIWTLEQIKQMPYPMNDPNGIAFNQINKKWGQTFVDYLQPGNSQNCDFPIIGPDGQEHGSCHWPGDFQCPTYNETLILDCYSAWTDLNQSTPAVRDYLLNWIRDFVPKYNIDGLRLDTSQHVPKWFLKEYQEAANVLILGEAMIPANMSFHASYQGLPNDLKDDRGPLTGLLNIPISYQWANPMSPSQPFQVHEISHETFENDAWNVWGSDRTSFTFMREALERQKQLYLDVNLLGNFLDSHDVTRFIYKHHGDINMLMNGLVWMFFYHGLPIFYYGTEDMRVSQQFGMRASMWYEAVSQRPYSETDLYKFTRAINQMRKDHGIAYGGEYAKELARIVHSDARTMAFVRADLVVAMSNGRNDSSPSFCLNMTLLPEVIQEACRGLGVVTILGTANNPVCRLWPEQELCIQMDHGTPAVFAPHPQPNPPHIEQDSLYAALGGALALGGVLVGFYAKGRMKPGSEEAEPLSPESDDSLE